MHDRPVNKTETLQSNIKYSLMRLLSLTLGSVRLHLISINVAIFSSKIPPIFLRIKTILFLFLLQVNVDEFCWNDYNLRGWPFEVQKNSYVEWKSQIKERKKPSENENCLQLRHHTHSQPFLQLVLKVSAIYTWSFNDLIPFSSI